MIAKRSSGKRASAQTISPSEPTIASQVETARRRLRNVQQRARDARARNDLATETAAQQEQITIRAEITQLARRGATEIEGAANARLITIYRTAAELVGAAQGLRQDVGAAVDLTRAMEGLDEPEAADSGVALGDLPRAERRGRREAKRLKNIAWTSAEHEADAGCSASSSRAVSPHFDAGVDSDASGEECLVFSDQPGPKDDRPREIFDTAQIDRLVDFAIKREELRRTRECMDPNIVDYRYLNVDTGDDKTSGEKDGKLRQLGEVPPHVYLLNISTMVLFGSYEFVTSFVPMTTFDGHSIISLALVCRDKHGHAFTDGYRVYLYNSESGDVGRAYMAYVEQVEIIREVWKRANAFDDFMAEGAGWQPLVDWLRDPAQIKGVKTFLAKEFILPLVRVGIVPDHPNNWSWSPMGSGAWKGHRRLYTDEAKKIKFTLAEVEEQLQEVYKYICGTFPQFAAAVGSKQRALTVHDVQNLECEFNKYDGICHNERGRRRHYEPYTGTSALGEGPRNIKELEKLRHEIHELQLDLREEKRIQTCIVDALAACEARLRDAVHAGS